ncbi:ureidoglycolate lyase, partial [Pseudomonas sp. NPDC087697]|uniref:ureidoglycolate lyase n=1 Tax=Pseudomonas sp. NPDC087697 TaxID=3364447 RepID=UPI00380D5FB7
EPVARGLRAFVPNGTQRIKYPPGDGPPPVLTIEKRDDFLVVDRSGTGNNCDEHFFKEDERLILAPHQ